VKFLYITSRYITRFISAGNNIYSSEVTCILHMSFSSYLINQSKESSFSVFFYFCLSSFSLSIHILGGKKSYKKKKKNNNRSLTKIHRKEKKTVLIIRIKIQEKEIDRHVICVLQKESSFNIQ